MTGKIDILLTPFSEVELVKMIFLPQWQVDILKHSGKVKIQLFLPMVKLVQEKPIQCLDS